MLKLSKLYEDYNALKQSNEKNPTQMSIQDKQSSLASVTRKGWKITVCDKNYNIFHKINNLSKLHHYPENPNIILKRQNPGFW